MKQSKHEIALAWAIAAYGPDLPPPEMEAAIIPGRKFRFDFAWPDVRVAVEIQGGTFGKGRSAHTGASLVRDHEKANLAALNGWRVLYFNAKDMTQRALPATVATIRQAIRRDAA